MKEIIEILLLIGAPSAVFAFFLRRFERKLDRQEADRREREQTRDRHDEMVLDMVYAMSEVSEATAVALKNGHTNGETDAALSHMRETREKHRDFLRREAVERINGRS